jgi:hypothetical protein
MDFIRRAYGALSAQKGFEAVDEKVDGESVANWLMA